MKFHFYLNEAYLDPEEKFYDYNTETFSGSDLFDINRQEIPHYNRLMKDPSYAEGENKTVSIEQITPNEYFEKVAEIFNSTKDKQISYVKNDKDIIDHLNMVLDTYHKKFPIPFLDLAEKGQEGRHRMYIAGERFGWDMKFPVAIIKWKDEELQRQIEKEKENSKNKWKIESAIQETLRYNYQTLDELQEQLKSELEQKFYEPVDFNLEEFEKTYVVTAKDIEVSFDKDKIKWIDPIDEIDDDIDSLSQEEIDQMMDEFRKIGLDI